MRGHLAKVRCLMIVILADIVITTMMSFATNSSIKIPLTVTEAIVHLITLFVVFLFLFDTFLFSYGLLGGLFNEIKAFIIMFPIYFFGSIAFNAWTIVSLFGTSQYVFYNDQKLL